MPWQTPPSTHLVGNTAGASVVQGPTLYLQGGANVTLSGTGQSIVVQAAGGTGGPGGGLGGIGAGTQTATAGTVVFSNGGGVSFGLSGSTRLTASVRTDYQSSGPYLTTAMASDAGSAFMSTSERGNYLGTANSFAQSTHTHGALALTNLTGTSASNGLSLSAAAAPAQTAYVFSNANGVSFGTAGSTVTASVATAYQSQGAYLTTAQPVGNYAGTVTGITGSIGLTANTSGVSVSIPAFLTTAQAPGAYLTTAMLSNASGAFAGIGTSATNASITLGTGGLAISVAAPGGAFSAGGSTDANGTTGLVGSQIVFFEGANITLSQSISGASASLSIVGPTPGVGGGATFDDFVWPQEHFTAMSAPVNGSNSIVVVSAYGNVTATRFNAYASVAVSSQTNTSSAYFDCSMWVGIYSNNAATLKSLTTASTAYWTSWSSNTTTGVGGLREFTCPMNVNMTPGHYFVAVNLSTTNTATGGTATTALGNTMTMYGNLDFGSALVASPFGVATANSAGIFSAQGVYSAAVNSAMTDISISGIAQSGTVGQRAPIAVRFRNV